MVNKRLVLLTNIQAHYQTSLGRAFSNKLKKDFAMVCWRAIPVEQKNLGWQHHPNEEWLINAWDSASESARAIEMLRAADVVVWGDGPPLELKNRVASGKLTFRYAERLFKRGQWRLFHPRAFKAIREIYKSSERESYHLLSVGPYCAGDFQLIRAFRGRSWRWGYFPECPIHSKPKDMNRDPVVLWAGRMIPWKRTDLLLHAAASARAHAGKRFTLRIVGCGPEEERLRALAAHLQISEMCEFRGPMTPDAVEREMEEADIYVLPSNRQEGWGVVLNEAMSRECCVIGNKSAGSVPWLIQDGVNGFTFDGSNAEKLGRILRRCVDHPDLRSELGTAARNTILDLWSPAVAAKRLLQLVEAVENGRNPPFEDGGPCSPV
jgi:glycosyltransferase involved in cell wall biosynthesis